MSNCRSLAINTPTRALLACFVVVVLSTALLPWVAGYGTQLFQVVVLGAWALVAAATTNAFADQHHQYFWPVAALLNAFLFSVLALPTYFVFRRRAPPVSSLALLMWLVFYLSCLFVFYPATDGPQYERPGLVIPVDAEPSESSPTRIAEARY